jgi:hypothetical protein
MNQPIIGTVGIHYGFSTRPRLLDYFLMLFGIWVSLFLTDWSRIRTLPQPAAPILVQNLAKLHPYLLFLEPGILLMWPLFYCTQCILGRRQGLSAGEWLWSLAWLAMLAWLGWVLWTAFGEPPDLKKTMVTAYVVFVLASAACSFLILAIDLVGRWPQPWTHHFALALFIWSAIPWAVVWIAGFKLE